MDRKEAENRWEKWKNQREYMKNYADDPNQPPEYDIIKEMIGKLDREAAEEKLKNPQIDPKEAKFETTLAKEISQNECPICLQLLVPPHHTPYILFPCGHTFCKQCIDSYLKKSHKKICALCKQNYKNMAKNIALQKLVELYWSKKDSINSSQTREKRTMPQVGPENHALTQPDSITALIDKDVYNKKLIQIRKRITLIETQNEDLMNKIVESRRKISAESETISIFDEQISKLKKKISVLEQELELAEMFKTKSINKVITNCIALIRARSTTWKTMWRNTKSSWS